MADVAAFSGLRFKGIPVFLDGRDYLVPSLSLEQFEVHFETLTAAIPEGETLPMQMKRLLPVMLLAVNRNYPEVTEAELRQWVDMTTFGELWQAVQNASGLKAVRPGE